MAVKALKKRIPVLNFLVLFRQARQISDENEYLFIVKNILFNDEFMKLKNFRHHNSSIYNHLVTVSLISFKIAKILQLDHVSTARGALLHDFYLFDWRLATNRPYKKRQHGFAHPQVALKNSRKQFSLNPIEEDIIIKHMWPLTFRMPSYSESLVVSFVDKFVASREYLNRFIRRTEKEKASSFISGIEHNQSFFMNGDAKQ